MKYRSVVAVLMLLTANTSAQSAAVSADGHLGECAFSSNQQMCNINRDEFISDYRNAYRRDYQAQRNVAFCLLDGCYGAVKKNRPLGCAWRIVILASGSSKVDASDRMNYDIMCRGKLDDTEMLVFRSQAKEIFKAVYKQTLTLK